MNKCTVISFLLFESFLHRPLGWLARSDYLVEQLRWHDSFPVLGVFACAMSVLQLLLWRPTRMGFLLACFQAPVVNHIAFKSRQVVVRNTMCTGRILLLLSRVVTTPSVCAGPSNGCSSCRVSSVVYGRQLVVLSRWVLSPSISVMHMVRMFRLLSVRYLLFGRHFACPCILSFPVLLDVRTHRRLFSLNLLLLSLH